MKLTPEEEVRFSENIRLTDQPLIFTMTTPKAWESVGDHRIGDLCNVTFTPAKDKKLVLTLNQFFELRRGKTTPLLYQMAEDNFADLNEYERDVKMHCFTIALNHFEREPSPIKSLSSGYNSRTENSMISDLVSDQSSSNRWERDIIEVLNYTPLQKRSAAWRLMNASTLSAGKFTLGSLNTKLYPERNGLANYMDNTTTINIFAHTEPLKKANTSKYVVNFSDADFNMELVWACNAIMNAHIYNCPGVLASVVSMVSGIPIEQTRTQMNNGTLTIDKLGGLVFDRTTQYQFSLLLDAYKIYNAPDQAKQVPSLVTLERDYNLVPPYCLLILMNKKGVIGAKGVLKTRMGVIKHNGQERSKSFSCRDAEDINRPNTDMYSILCGGINTQIDNMQIFQVLPCATDDPDFNLATRLVMRTLQAFKKVDVPVGSTIEDQFHSVFQFILSPFQSDFRDFQTGAIQKLPPQTFANVTKPQVQQQQEEEKKESIAEYNSPSLYKSLQEATTLLQLNYWGADQLNTLSDINDIFEAHSPDLTEAISNARKQHTDSYAQLQNALELLKNSSQATKAPYQKEFDDKFEEVKRWNGRIQTLENLNMRVQNTWDELMKHYEKIRVDIPAQAQPRLSHSQGLGSNRSRDDHSMESVYNVEALGIDGVAAQAMKKDIEGVLGQKLPPIEESGLNRSLNKSIGQGLNVKPQVNRLQEVGGNPLVDHQAWQKLNTSGFSSRSGTSSRSNQSQNPATQTKPKLEDVLNDLKRKQSR